jgi:hypothetical protein
MFLVFIVGLTWPFTIYVPLLFLCYIHYRNIEYKIHSAYKYSITFWKGQLSSILI